jgi:hypothetical protein
MLGCEQMRFSSAFGTVIAVTALCLCAQEQNTPNKDTPANEMKGIPPRAAPADYQAHASTGTVAVAAEFLGHSIPTADGSTYTNEDYVAVETGLFGLAGARLNISVGNFSILINGKKKKKEVSLPSQPYGMVFRSLKDPVWEDKVAVEAKAAKSSTTIGKGGVESDPPAPAKMPLEMQRAMQQRVQKVAMPEGDRALPQAGLLFFPYHGKVDAIQSMELVYTGPAGTARVTLQP